MFERPGGAHLMATALREVVTIRQFRRLTARSDGLIVITDAAYPPRVHTTDCPWLRERYFEMKVIRNRRRNGRYFWAPNKRLARSQLGAAPCEKCRP
jgi:hypothetical protein